MKKNLLKLALLLPLVGTTTLTSCGPTGTLVGVTYYDLQDQNMSKSWKPMYNHLVEQYGWDIMEINGAGQNSTIETGVESLINSGSSGLIINVNQPTQAPGLLEKAKQADIPVVFYNKEPADNDGNPTPEVVDGYDKAFFVGTTASDAGVMQGKMAFDYLKANASTWNLAGNADKIEVFVILGEAGHAEAEQRTEYCVKELKRLLDTEDHNIVNSNGVKLTGADVDFNRTDDVKEARSTGGKTWDGATAASFVSTLIAGNYDLVFSNNDDMAVAALNDAAWPEKLPIWGVDCSESGVNSMKSNDKKKLLGSVYNDNITQPRVAAFLLDQLLQGKTRDEAAAACTEEFGASVVYEETGHAFRIQYKAIPADKAATDVVTAQQWIAANPNSK